MGSSRRCRRLLGWPLLFGRPGNKHEIGSQLPDDGNSLRRYNRRFQIPVPTAIIDDRYATPSYASEKEPGLRNAAAREFAGKKIAAGICGILLGGLGVHKFILGFNSAGTIMLSVYLICVFSGCLLIVPVVGAMAIQVVGLVEGILYLTKSDEEFYQTYAIERREWF